MFAIEWFELALPFFMFELWMKDISELTPFVADDKHTRFKDSYKGKNFLITLSLLKQTKQRQINAILNRVSFLDDFMRLSVFLCTIHIHTSSNIIFIHLFRNIFQMDKLLIIRKRIRLWPDCLAIQWLSEMKTLRME